SPWWSASSPARIPACSSPPRLSACGEGSRRPAPPRTRRRPPRHRRRSSRRAGRNRNEKRARHSLPTALQAAILGVIQGLTEFLPVSSTAHLLLSERLMGFSDPDGVFTVMI